MQPHPFQPGSRLLGHPPIADDAAGQRLAPEQKVLGERELADEVAFLMDDGDAVVGSRARRGEMHFPPVHVDVAAIRAMDTGGRC